MAGVPDPFMLAAVLIIGLMLIFGNIYFIAHYSHYADSFFGSSTACKAILVSVKQEQVYQIAIFHISSYFVTLTVL